MTLRELREAHALTLVRLAERIAAYGVTVTPEHLSNVELGHKCASAALTRAWRLALGLSTIDLTAVDPSPPAATRRRTATAA